MQLAAAPWHGPETAATVSGRDASDLPAVLSFWPLGSDVSMSTPLDQPCAGQLGHTGRDASSSATVVMTNESYRLRGVGWGGCVAGV